MNDQASQALAPQPTPPPVQAQPGKARKVLFGCGGCLTVLVVLLIAGGACVRDPDLPAIYKASIEVEKYVVSPESLKVDRGDCKIAARTKDDFYRIVYVPFSSKNRFGVVLPGYMLAVVMKLDGVGVVDRVIFEKPPTVADLKQLMAKTGGDDWEIESWLR